jgi:Holliday junction resolvase RusA-like endonuclease
VARRGNGKAVVRRVNLAALLVDDAPREPGSVVCSGVVAGRPTPWKAPHLSIKPGRDGLPRRGVVRDRGYRAYEAWKGSVAAAAFAAMRRSRPYGGPVELRLVFYVRPGGRTQPDLTNIQKSTEDGLQGSAISNDRQVHRVVAELVLSASEPQRCEFSVIAI